MRRILLFFPFLLFSLVISAQTALSGKVVDEDNNNDPLPFATVALKKGDNVVLGTNTDIDGNYFFSNVDPGTFDVEVTYTGYATRRIEGVEIFAGKTNVVDVGLTSGVVLDEVVVTAYDVPLVEQDNTTQGRTVTSTEIRNLPTRNINAIAATAAGLASADEGGEINIRGSRANATDYYVDGIRVQGNLLPESEIDQLQVITGGVEARYGDVTGGVISITTKGPSSSFGGGLEVETSEPFNDFGQNLFGLNLNGPILKNSSGQSIIGFRFAGRYTQRTDDDPSAVPIYRINDSKLAELQENPLVLRRNDQGQLRTVVGAEFLTDEDVNTLSVRPFEEFTRLDLTGKIDARLSDAIDVTLTGFYSDTEDQFTPSENDHTNGRSWQLLNSHRNPTDFDTDYRVNFRFRHRLGRQGAGSDSKSLIQNASYILQFGYENNRNDISDPIHGDNYFDYGYVGNFDIDFIPVFDPIRDLDFNSPFFGQITDFEHVGYRSVFRGYDDSNSPNPVLSNFNNIVPELTGIGSFDDVVDDSQIGFTGAAGGFGIDNFLSLNGQQRGALNDLHSHHAQVGTVYNLVTKTDNDIYTFNANASFQLVPGSSDKSRHTIDLGIMYEQRTNRNWQLNPRRLWDLARVTANQPIDGVPLDSMDRQIIGMETIESDTGMIQVPVFANAFSNPEGRTFYQSVRELTGTPLFASVNTDELDPNSLSLSMFGPQEVTGFGTNGLLNYYGYDYLGNEFNGTFDDFFAIDPATGLPSFNVADRLYQSLSPPEGQTWIKKGS
ncbi:MAG: TonB-dependent receptor [Bacteroidota bacterium]